MSVPQNPDDGEPTVAMPGRSVVNTALPDVVPWLAAARRRRRLALYTAVAIVFVAGIAGGAWFFLPRGERLLVGSGQPPREVARPQTTQPAGPPAGSSAPGSPDKPPGPRQLLTEIFEGRDRGHSVTASIDAGAVRISSSKAGYVYVLATSASQSVDTALFVAVLFPRAPGTNNRIQAGQSLKLPDVQWPPNAAFLAIVSDEPRDIDVLGPLAGKVICASATPCSQSYGAVVFSHDGTDNSSRSPAVTQAPAARPPSKASRRCSDILERASLGEPLTDEEQLFLRRDCR